MSAAESRGSKLTTRRWKADRRETERSAARQDLKNGEHTPAQRVNTKVRSSGRPRPTPDNATLAPVEVVSMTSGSVT